MNNFNLDTNSQQDLNKNKKSVKGTEIFAAVFVFILALALVISFIVAGNRESKENKNTDTAKNTPTTQVTPNLTQTPSPTPKAENKVVVPFKKTFISGETMDDEIYLYEVEKKEIVATGIKGIGDVFSNKTNSWIAYTKGSDRASIYLYNVNTKETKQITENKIEVYEPSLQLPHHYTFSPNGKILLYELSYFDTTSNRDCCDQSDIYPKAKSGYYSYNLETGQKVYLGKFLLPTNWDKNSENIYISDGEDYHEYKLANNSFKINVKDGKATLLDKNPNGRDAHVYVDDLKTKVVLENGSPLKVIKDNNTKIIDSGKNFADMQPLMYLSPDMTKVIYERQVASKDGISYYRKNLIDLNTLEVETVLEGQLGENYKDEVIWLNTEEFITSVRMGTNYDSMKTDLILYNIKTQEKKILTTTGDISIY